MNGTVSFNAGLGRESALKTWMQVQVRYEMPGPALTASTSKSLEPVCHFLRKVKLSELDDERIVVVLHDLMSVQSALQVWPHFQLQERRRIRTYLRKCRNRV
jgi:hypothetical protein